MSETREERITALEERIRRMGRAVQWLRVGIGGGCILASAGIYLAGYGFCAPVLLALNDVGSGPGAEVCIGRDQRQLRRLLARLSAPVRAERGGVGLHGQSRGA